MATRQATFDELDAVKKQLVSLEKRVDGIVTGLNNTLRSAQQADQRMQTAIRAAETAATRTERLDVAALLRLQTLDVPRLTAAMAAVPALKAAVEKLVANMAKVQRG